MKYKILLDVLWLEMFVLNLLLLWLVNLWRYGRLKSGKKLVMGAALGAFLSVILLLVPCGKIGGLVCQLICSGLMLLIAVSDGYRGLDTLKLLGRNVGIYYTLLFLFGGTWHFIRIQGISQLHSTIGLLLYSFVLSLLTARGICFMRQKKNMLCEVQIYIADKPLCVNALIDTGNGLREPCSDSPVCIIEKRALYEVITAKIPATCLCYIPYHAIGREGTLLGVRIPRMEIRQNQDVKTCENVVLAVYSGQLSQNNKYQMILHPDLVYGCD